MIDYIESTIFCDKDTLNTSYLQLEATYPDGRKRYSLNGCKRIELMWDENNQILKFKGSISYFMQGNNFSCDKRTFFEGIDYISQLIGVNLWYGMVDVLEYGVIFSVGEANPKDFIKHHVPDDASLIQEDKGKDRFNMRRFNDKNVSLKLYNAKFNLQNKAGTDWRKIIQQAGFNPDDSFIKWEAHYLRPEYLNHGRGIYLYQLQQEEWLHLFRSDLYEQYLRLKPMSTIELPTNKKDLSAIDIMAMTFAESKINEGTTLEELKNILYSKINSIPDEILSKSDKDARKRTIRTTIAKIKESPESEYDLSWMIQKALEVEEEKEYPSYMVVEKHNNSYAKPNSSHNNTEEDKDHEEKDNQKE